MGNSIYLNQLKGTMLREEEERRSKGAAPSLMMAAKMIKENDRPFHMITTEIHISDLATESSLLTQVSGMEKSNKLGFLDRNRVTH